MTAITMFFALFGGMVHAFRKKARMLREEMGSKRQQVMFDMMLQDQLADALAMGSDSSDEEVRERRARTLRQKYATRQVELMDVAQQIRDMTAFVLVRRANDAAGCQYFEKKTKPLFQMLLHNVEEKEMEKQRRAKMKAAAVEAKRASREAWRKKANEAEAKLERMSLGRSMGLQ